MAVNCYPHVHYPAEVELLTQAVQGDVTAINKVLIYLSSTNSDLRHMMQVSLHDVSEPWLWRHVLRCLAMHRWLNGVDCERRQDPEASARIDDALIEAFVNDSVEAESLFKNEALHSALQDADTRLRDAAACVLGLRGDVHVIPALAETLRHADLPWKLRAIQALGSLPDPRCGELLIEALDMDRGPLHKAARCALTQLGPMAEPALLQALEHSDSHIRWHAARGLGDLGRLTGMAILAEGLCDENQSVRWATADALARMGPPAIEAILEVLVHHRLDEPLREATYHALHAIVSRSTRSHLDPLLKALRSGSADLDAPLMAQRLLLGLELQNTPAETA